MDDQQVVVLIDQRNGAFAAEIDIGFIDDHHRIRIAVQDLLDGVERQEAARGGVGVGENDAAVGRAAVVGGVDAEVFGERQAAVVDAVEPAIHRVEAVGDVGEEDGRVVLEQGLEGVGEDFVRTIADENLGGRHGVAFGDGLLEQVGVGVGVEAQACAVIAELRLHRRQRLGRGRVGVFVGVEFDQIGDLGLFARHIGGEVADDLAPEAAHGIFTEGVKAGRNGIMAFRFNVFSLNLMRQAEVTRNTLETQITVRLNLDGTGQGSFATGVPFLDHMLDQIARHGLIDLDIVAKGDLHIDAHHTVEDLGITLGQALAKAWGDKKGLTRYGHSYVPLDEALSRVVIDLSGRPGLEYHVEYSRAMIGSFDVDLFSEFFHGLVNHAGMTLHIDNLRGKNAHHQAETIFKAFGRALRMAVTPDERMAGVMPSTKGTLNG